MILREFLKRQGEENIRRAIFSSLELIKKAPKALKNSEIDLFGQVHGGFFYGSCIRSRSHCSTR